MSYYQGDFYSGDPFFGLAAAAGLLRRGVGAIRSVLRPRWVPSPNPGHLTATERIPCQNDRAALALANW